jgi:hypothetical protein
MAKSRKMTILCYIKVNYGYLYDFFTPKKAGQSGVVTDFIEKIHTKIGLNP